MLLHAIDDGACEVAVEDGADVDEVEEEADEEELPYGAGDSHGFAPYVRAYMYKLLVKERQKKRDGRTCQ